MSQPMTVECPTCGAPVEWSAKSEFRPFCSHRCKLIDLGNWTGAAKYDDLAKLAPRAETCHAKCHFTAVGPNEDDFRRSLIVLKDAGFSGPLALIYDGPDADEWANLDREWAIVSEIFAPDVVSA